VAPTPARSRSRARLCRHDALAQLCNPHACTLTREVKVGPLAIFPLRRTSPGRCPPDHRTAMAIAMEVYFMHAAAGERSTIYLAVQCMPRHRFRTRPCPTAGACSQPPLVLA
jgi:hypothetical protein